MNDDLPLKAKLTTQELPSVLFVLIDEAKGGSTVTLKQDVDNQVFMPVWTSKNTAFAVSSNSEIPLACMENDKWELLQILLSNPVCEFLVLNPNEKYLTSDSYSIASEEEARILHLHDFESVFSFYDDLVDENEHKSKSMGFCKQLAKMKKDLKPEEIMILASEIFNSVSEKLTSGNEGTFSEEESLWVDALFGTSEEDLIDVPEDYFGEDGVSITVEISDGEDFFSKQKESRTALQTCPPPPECTRCGENTWTYISQSPNGKSATWECTYCSKKAIAKAGHAKAQSNSVNREPIPREVQREVWRRDEARCVQCGSQEKLEFDHIIPVSKGGANTVRNIQLLCEKCNRTKSDDI